MDSPEVIFSALRGQRVAVVGHVRPDGDCIGCQIAVTRLLRTLNAEAYCVFHDGMPDIFKSFVEDTPCGAPNAHYDAVVAVDCSDLGRLGNFGKRFESVYLNIDHHTTNTQFAKNNIINPNAAATAEMVAQLFRQHNWTLDRTAAKALYAGLVTDTDRFTTPSTTTISLEMATWLVALGVRPSDIGNAIFEHESWRRVQLLRRYLNSLKLEFGHTICIGCITEADKRELQTAPGDSDGFVNYARSIEGVQIAILLEESGADIKVSLRGKNPSYRLDRLAYELWGGGGHPCAAGFTFPNEKLADAEKKILNASKLLLNEMLPNVSF